MVCPEGTLPDRCVKCDAPADGRTRTVRLRWRDTGTTLLVLVLLLFVPLVFSRAYWADVEVGVCRRHLDRLRLVGVSRACVLLAGFGMIAAGVALGAEYGYLLLAGVVVVAAAPIYLSMTGNSVTASRIEPRLVWVKGVCPEYLAKLPRRTAG